LSAPKDLVGKRFGRLTVVSLTDGRRHRERHWMCVCDCGNGYIVSSNGLKSGHATQCYSCAKKQAGVKKRTDSYYYPALRKRYSNMKTRCYDQSYPEFHLYGGRGIKICDEWLYSFHSFVRWALDSGYDPSLTIDRIDTNGDYCPENCRWVGAKEQANNRRTNRFLTFNGISDTVANWSEKTGIPYKTIYRRITRSGWSVERALTTPARLRDDNNRRYSKQS